MSLSQQELEEYWVKREQEDKLQRMTWTHICAECGGRLITPWNGERKEVVLCCGTDRNHKGFTKLKGYTQTWREGQALPIEIANKIQQKEEKRMEEELGKEKTTELAPYIGVVSLTKEQATAIANTLWPKAPLVEKQKAALICAIYGLNPLKQHVFLIPYWNKETKQNDWSIQLGIGATRLIASRKTDYSYLDGPRIMTKEEQETIMGEVDDTKWWAITVIQDKKNNKAPGYGNYPKDGHPKGENKGNTPQNMAMIRSERNAFDRLLPGEMPQGVEVIDAQFTELEPEKTGREKKGTSQTPAPVPIKGEDFPKPEAIKNLGDLFNASQTHFKMSKDQTLKELGYSTQTAIANPGEEWKKILEVKTSKEK